MKKVFATLLSMMLLATPAFADSSPKSKLLESSDSLYVDEVAYDSLKAVGQTCVNYSQDLSKDSKSEITTIQDCTVLSITPLKSDPTNQELSLSYTVDGQEIIVKVRQNYKTELMVGQKVKAGEVIAVFDKHVRIGADLICISAYIDGIAVDTSEYVKGLAS